ncbi:MAG: polysaccharide deacetylase family protein [Deltaproteobacteria bacterium]|nr:polysaccharide deacetylase family protein [Deltaproteobacteria bacterium]
MHLTVTIDTEEDNWSNYDSKPVLSNLEKIPSLQELFDRYGVKPNYLISYPVASDEKSAAILRGIMEDGRCEIGTHLHTWNTPPFEEEKTPRNTMLSNLEEGLQFRKLEALHSKIRENFGFEPVTFRSGRWGFDGTVARTICRMGYKVDTSVSPYSNWEMYHGPDFSGYSPKPHEIRIDVGNGPEARIMEVPATIAFLQDDYPRCNRRMKAISGSALSRFRLLGILDRLKLLNKVCLSPEPDTAENMIGLAESMRRNGYKVLNLFFHSTSLKHGLNHFTKTEEEAAELMRRIERFLEYAAEAGIRPMKLSESTGLELQGGRY